MFSEIKLEARSCGNAVAQIPASDSFALDTARAMGAVVSECRTGNAPGELKGALVGFYARFATSAKARAFMIEVE